MTTEEEPALVVQIVDPKNGSGGSDDSNLTNLQCWDTALPPALEAPTELTEQDSLLTCRRAYCHGSRFDARGGATCESVRRDECREKLLFESFSGVP